MTLYILTNPETARRLYYTSVAAFLEDDQNPIFVTPQHWSQSIARHGYPLEYKGWKIEKEEALSTTDVRKRRTQIL